MVLAKTAGAREAPGMAEAPADAIGVHNAASLDWVQLSVKLLPPAYGWRLDEFYHPVCHRPATIFRMFHHFL